MLTTDLNHILPELALTLGALIVLVAGLLKPDNTNSLKWLTIVTQVGTAFLCFTSTTVAAEAFSGQLSISSETQVTRLLIALTGLLVTLATSNGRIIKNRVEYFLLVIGLQLGAQITVMANHAVTILLAIELMSLSSYALAGYLFNSRSSEAGMKYFVMGSTATALMAFGFSWIYGSTGELDWSTLGNYLADSPKVSDIGSIGFYLVAAGLLFKLSAAPMHLWAPDVYESTPFSVINLFSTLPKIAAVILMSRLVTAELFSSPFWITFVVAVASMSLILGHLPALWQTNARRLLGYSSIAQGGFLLAALSIAPGQQIVVLLFYLLSMAMAITLVIICLDWFEANYNTMSLDSFAGLGRVAIWPSAGLTIGLLSLTGLPPFAGFSAKLLLFSSIWSSHPNGPAGITFLIFLSVFMTVVALFFYIKIPFQLYLKHNYEKSTKVDLDPYTLLLISFLSAMLIALFLYPQAIEFLMVNAH
ncbi:MAG: NADH-quinone oxidoreductase subunit N [Cyclobacteriaceae bacterium]